MDARRCPADGAEAITVDTLPPGARIGAYRIERVLGEGGMGFVYEATHEVLNRRSAIKLLRSELAAQPQIVSRFVNEARAVNVIDHQNIVSVYDYGDQLPGCVYLVMEYLEGETLDEVMRKHRPLPLPLLLHAFGQIARALAAAHAKQIVHRDLKPANVFVIARDHNPCFIKLLDFGIAQLRGVGATHLTLAGSVMGTPQYMSPEQISGGAVDARSDVWALGVMMYRAATGQAPFRGEAFAELADKILHHPPPLAAQVAAVPGSLSRLIARCLERRVDDRCPSMAVVLAGLDEVKREAGLDDDAILAAVHAGAGAAGRATSQPLPDPTRGSLAGSVPRYQGADAAGRSITGARRSRVRWYALAALAAAGVGVGAYAAVGRGGHGDGSTASAGAGAALGAPASADPGAIASAGAGASSGSPATTVPGAIVATGPTATAGSGGITGPGAAGAATAGGSIKAAFAGGDAAAARALAERDLRAAIGSGTLQQQGFAVDALGMARVAAGAPLLYAALAQAPDVRVKAAHALGELGLPDAAPKLRAALADSGERIKVDLAAALYRLGDRDAAAILRRATGDPGSRLTAAAAMAAAADDAGRSVLAEVMAATPPGREAWRRAAGGLVQLGDAGARKLLAAELAQPDPARSIGAAEILARAGEASARELLARVAADPSVAQPGEAALALARLGDRRALGWVARGLTSADAGDRKRALAICGALPGVATPHAGTVAALATDDPDPGVRMTAEAVLLGL